MSADRNKTLARRYWEEVVNQGKVAVLDEIFAADDIQHHAGMPPGIAGIKRFVEASMVGFPDQHATVDAIHAEGDYVTTRTTIRGTHSGPFNGIAATGRPIVVEVMDIWRVEDDKLVEHWGIFDNLSLMRQLGAIADPKAGSASSSADEAAILAEVLAFSLAWNRGDAQAAAAFFAEDGVRIGAAGDVQHGRAELEAAYDQLLHGRFAGATVTQEPGTVRMLGPELAIWQGGIEIAPGAGAPAIKGHVVQVMKKVAGRWLVLEAHPKLFPPAPR